MDLRHMDMAAENGTVIRKGQEDTVIFTGVWHPGPDDRNLAGEELLPGELSAVVFQVGCYTVRSARRVYRLREPGLGQEPDGPAGQADTESVRKDMGSTYGGTAGYAEGSMAASGVMYPSWSGRLCIVHEISARHGADPGNAFTVVCRVLQPVSADGCGYIGDIYAVRENDTVPDEAASLIVYSHYEGNSSGTDTWYRLAPDGRITRSEKFSFPTETEDLKLDS